MKPRILVARLVFPKVVERLKIHFDVEENPRDDVLDKPQLIARLRDKHGAFVTGSERIDAEVLEACPDLRAVCNMAVGYNNIDVAACTARGVMCTNTPDVLTESTADLGFALMMAAARRITEAEHFLRRGEWTKWSVDLFAGGDVNGTTLGILGMGRIGQAIARRGFHGFGMKVLYHNRSRLDAALEAACGASHVDKSSLLKQADHLVVVVPYSAQTHHAIGPAELSLMKSSATLTNIARGGVVDESALAQALASGALASAALDVFEGEPKVNPALLALSNIVLTPHIGSATLATRRAMADLAADNLIAALGFGRQAGHPPSLLNAAVLEGRPVPGRTG